MPKNFLGMKLPRQTRKKLNRLLRGVSKAEAHPVAIAALAAVSTIILARLEKPVGDPAS